ncbi:virB8 family protein (plasmid) [Rhizobium sp. CB3171]|uniref:virB8 family protein n=1 Tax=Rhizobium sp. CB3171 TaxID=3039157 RepID=UPI0024B0F616|nr:virB8 family protein [Rhizobium sp. CB3171]WFU07116.1 virB8 family protein [Rhizobium sp. CB3171]
MSDVTEKVGAPAKEKESPLPYYRDAAIWEKDMARRNRWSRSLAWCVATVASIIAVAAVGALILALPLKTYEPYMVVVDKSTGFVEVKRPLADGPLQQDESMGMFDIVRYVKARETYDPKALKDNFDLAQLLSTGDASRELVELFSPANKVTNPVVLYGRNTVVDVTVKSVTFPNQRTALVRFMTEEKSQANTIQRHWVSLIRFRYTGVPAKNEIRFQNPLGFQVLEYRRDQETAPAPTSESPK